MAAADRRWRVLVTGATGRVGFPIARELARQHVVYGLARGSRPGDAERLRQAGVEPILGDVAELDLATLPPGLTHVFHAAARIGRDATADWQTTFEVNAQATGRLIAACSGVRGFVLCSSGSTYAYQGQRPLRETDPPGVHLGTYSLSKIAAEAVARFAAAEHGVPLTIIRIFSTYGPLGGAPADRLRRIRAGQAVVLHPDAPNHYNPIYEDDYVRLGIRALEVASVPPCVVNWAGSETVSAEEYCAYLGELAGREVTIRYDPSAPWPLWPDVTLMHEILGHTRVPWRDGMRRMAESGRGSLPSVQDDHRAPAWPPLPVADWEATRDTLQLWTQVVGKIRMANTPLINHWWNVTLYVTARGLGTSLIPHGPRGFQIDFDLVDHRLDITVTDGTSRSVGLEPMSVATLHREVMARLDELGLSTRIWTMPVEILGAIPFELDEQHAAYDAEAVQRFWLALVQMNRVFEVFRARFIGKVSPVHLFWGGLDLAVTRFSGRVAPPHPGGAPHCGPQVMWEAYSHEVSSAGYWPGPDGEGVFYSYAYPEPAGYRSMPVRPSAARYDETLGEFTLPYTAVRTAADPDAVLLDFLQSTYEAAAECARWDRADLERPPRGGR